MSGFLLYTEAFKRECQRFYTEGTISPQPQHPGNSLCQSAVTWDKIWAFFSVNQKHCRTEKNQFPLFAKRSLTLNHRGVTNLLLPLQSPLLNQTPVLRSLSVPGTWAGAASEHSTDGTAPGRTAAEKLKSKGCFWAQCPVLPDAPGSAAAHGTCGRPGVIPYQHQDHLEDLAGKTVNSPRGNKNT